MDKLEQEIKRRLAQSTSLEEVNCEVLWNSISEAYSQAAADRKKRRGGFIWFLLAAGIAGVCAFMALSRNTSVDYFPRLVHESELTNSLNSNQSPQHSTSSTQESNSLFIDAQSSIPAGNMTVFKPSISETIETKYDANPASKDKTEKAEARTDLKLQLPSNKDGFTMEQDRDTSDEPFDQTTHKSNSNSNKANSKTSVDKEFQAVEAVRLPTEWKPELLIPQSVSLLDISSTPIKSPLLNSQILPESRKSITFNLYGGSLLSQHTFKNGTPGFADSLNINLSSEIGYSFGCIVRIKRGNNWNMFAGLEYSQWNDRFDKMLLSDTLVELNQDFLPARNIRTVKHHNSAAVISIPVQLELFKDIKRIRLGVGIGASYSFVVDQNGRLLRDEFTVSNYSQNEKRYTNFLSARVSPSVGFKLNKRVMLNSFCTFGIQRHGTNSINQLKSRSVAMMPSIGLTFNY